MPSTSDIILAAGLFRIVLLVLAADAHPHFPDDATEKLPDGNLDGLYADLVTELDDDPVLVGSAGGEHVPVAGLVEQGRGVLCLRGGRVDAGGAVGGGIVVLAVVGVRGGGRLLGGGRGRGERRGEGRVWQGGLCVGGRGGGGGGGGGGQSHCGGGRPLPP